MKYLLAGDIGGTKCLMALASIDDGHLRIQYETSLPSADYSTIEFMLEAFFNEAKINTQEIMATVLAVAGPIEKTGKHTHCRLTNLPWQASSESLSRWLNHTPVEIINDFAAIGYALNHLTINDHVVLQKGQPDPQAPQLAVGAGTGLGLCMVDKSDTQTRVYPSESGHVHFAPANDEQLALTQYWLRRQGHCSREFLLSGPGILHIAEYLQQDRDIQPGEALAHAMQIEDSTAALSRAALDRSDPLAIHTLRLFTSIYAAQLSDLALTFLPMGGLHIAGGIAAKILPLLEAPEFMEEFRNNPAMGHLLERIPVSVITTGRSGLIGALHHALEISRT